MPCSLCGGRGRIAARVPGAPGPSPAGQPAEDRGPYHGVWLTTGGSIELIGPPPSVFPSAAPYEVQESGAQGITGRGTARFAGGALVLEYTFHAFGLKTMSLHIQDANTLIGSAFGQPIVYRRAGRGEV